MKHVILTGFFVILLISETKAFDIIQAAGCRTNSLGRCSVSSKDFWSVLNNPAGFSSYNDLSLGIYYENKFMMKELSKRDAGFIIPAHVANIGISFSQFGYEHYNENIIGIGLSRNFGPDISIGLKLYYIIIKFSNDYEMMSAPTFDIGMQYRINESLFLGAYIFNPANIKFKSLNNNKIPIIMKIGLSYFVNDDFMICSEIEENFNDDFSFRSGLEYEIHDDLFIRSGFQLNPEMFTFGIGYKCQSFFIDIAAQMSHDLGASLSCSLIYKINERNNS